MHGPGSRCFLRGERTEKVQRGARSARSAHGTRGPAHTCLPGCGKLPVPSAAPSDLCPSSRLQKALSRPVLPSAWPKPFLGRRSPGRLPPLALHNRGPDSPRAPGVCVCLRTWLGCERATCTRVCVYVFGACFIPGVCTGKAEGPGPGVRGAHQPVGQKVTFRASATCGVPVGSVDPGGQPVPCVRASTCPPACACLGSCSVS